LDVHNWLVWRTITAYRCRPRGVFVATTDHPSPTTDRNDQTRHPLYSGLIGLATLGVLLQGLWAGLFVQEGGEYQGRWVEVHALDGEVTIALAALATVAAFVFLRRARKDLLVGSAVFTVLLLLAAYIGGEIGSNARLTAVHFPLALALMGLAVWLSLRSTRRG
jgi:hypothetical protein